MRKERFVPVICCLLALSGCGGGGQRQDLRVRYQQMSGCDMEARVYCTQYGSPWEAVLKCRYEPDGERVIEVVAPESIAGATVTLDGASRFLAADGVRINAGTVSAEALSPSDALPRLMDALRDGWLLEENAEEWNGVPCVRLAVDQTGAAGGKIVSTVWLRQADATPLRGEIAVEGETVLTAEFTDFAFTEENGP